MTTEKLIISIAVMALVTLALRVLPFLVFAGRKTPQTIDYLGKVLPFAIMGMLVVYCLKDISFTSVNGCVPMLIASAVVVLSYVWKKNTLISIVGGTVCYMLLIRFVFV